MLPIRYVQCFLLVYLAFTALYLRVNLSVAIVAMTNNTSANPDFPQLDWDLKTRSDVLSAIFWGFFFQVFSGQLGQLVSVKPLLLWSSVVCALLALLTPLAATQGGWGAVYILRLVQGFCESFYTPLGYKLASRWAPPEEITRFVGYTMNGATLGLVLGVAVSGLLANSRGGWPSVFYVSGAIGLSWSALWAWLGADSPLTHPTISPAERDFLKAALENTSEKNLLTPWRSILTSMPVWALIASHMSSGWGMTIVSTHVTAYLNSVLGLDIETNGFVSALTYFIPWVCTFPLCWLADYLIKERIMPVVLVRKISSSLCLGVFAAVLYSFCLVGHNRILAITILIAAITLTAFMFCGFLVNHLDLSPNFAGVLMGISSTMEMISCVLASLSVGWIVSDATSEDQWEWVFILTAVVVIAGNLVFVIFGSSELQKWNSPSEEKEMRRNSVISKHSFNLT